LTYFGSRKHLGLSNWAFLILLGRIKSGFPLAEVPENRKYEFVSGFKNKIRPPERKGRGRERERGRIHVQE
jgi:hypothetical protein